LGTSTTIEQSGTNVTLIVRTPEGEEERIERELEEYGLVVTGQITPEAYISDPIEAMRLRQKLEIASLEVRQTKELLSLANEQYGARIASLERQNELLMKMLDKGSYERHELVKALTTLSLDATENSKVALDGLIDIIERGASDDDIEVIKEQLETLKGNDGTLFERLQTLVWTGAIQGASGNFVYSLLKNLIASMS
jgi:hypothetical protein